MAADKRDIKRLKKRLAVRFGEGEASRIAFSEDISLTGMFIKTANIYPPNSKITVELDLANQTVSVVARVMWAKKVPQNLFHLVKKSGMGIRILSFLSGQDYYNQYFSSLPEN